METFVNWLKGNIGTAGDYTYKTIHIVSAAVVVMVTVFFGILSASKKLTAKQKRTMLVSVASFQLVFEVVWRVIFLTVIKCEPKNIWPMYPCNLAGILLPIIALCNFKAGKRIFYLFGFIGGVLTFIMPNGIYNKNVLTFPILKSILQHTGLLIIPSIEYFSKTYRPSAGDFGYVFCGLLIHTFNTYVLDPVIGHIGDFMFLESGLPFAIPGIPNWITTSVFALAVLFLLCCVLDIKTSKVQLAAFNNKVKTIFAKKEGKETDAGKAGDAEIKGETLKHRNP